MKPTEGRGLPILDRHLNAIDLRDRSRLHCVTDNVAEFKRVPALRVENWLR
jgi:hypothetical protein